MGTNSQLKKENILQVLQFVNNKDNGITKRDIATHTGLTITTIQNIISDLEQIGVVNCFGVSSNTGGRKAQYYGINSNYRYLVGVSLRTDRISVGIFDYTINLLHSKSNTLLLSEKSVEEVIHVIADMVNDSLVESGISKTMIVGIGINIPGPVDYENGRVIAIRGYPKWKNIALRDMVASLTGLSVYVDKDTYSCLSLLNWQKIPGGAVNVMYIVIEGGIGAAVMFNGKIIRGNHGVVAEIGHITVQENGKRCACGNYGCLETISSDFAVISRARAELRIPPQKQVTIDELVVRSNEGDKKLERIFEEAAMCLSVTIRNVFAMYDPDEIFINCRWLSQKKTLYFKLLDSLYDDNNLIDRRNVLIKMIDIEDFGLKSAAAIVAATEIESLNSSIFSGKQKHHVNVI